MEVLSVGVLFEQVAEVVDGFGGDLEGFVATGVELVA